ncbi:hypothetical protein [Hymenobacter guriensis]|uniref:Uncharacterized protein n=1 Tax=Hymenobacter guriensis TaxID=2793065 RepID=A0ABS0KX17_9BACT|nr:hypothetical protein [Hymenobacter guriensis]MBG8552351.1 hypothetical protein [Hymenobacter guriensis]
MSEKKTKKPALKAEKPETAAAPVAAERATVPAPTADKPAPPKAKETKVKFLRSHPSFGYFAGDEATISTEAYEAIEQRDLFFKKL